MLKVYFGANAPELIDLITVKIEFCRGHQNEEDCSRNLYQLFQMTETELERYQARKVESFQKRKAEEEELAKKQRKYIEYVTEEIMSRAGDLGVTLFMPHVIQKNWFKSVVDAGDKLRLTAKEKTTMKITGANLGVINFEQQDFPKVLFEYLSGKEVFAVCWKTSDDELRSTEGTECTF